MILNVGKKKYTIKYGYKAVAKSGIIKRSLEIENIADGDDYAEMIETMLGVVADMVLAGLQKTESSLSVDYDNKDDVREKTEKVYDLLDDYLATDEALSVPELYQELTMELFNAGFFGKKSEKMEQIAQEVDATVIPMDHKQS